MYSRFVIGFSLSIITSCGNPGEVKQQTLKLNENTGQSALMHIAINAIDLDSTVAFYKNVFGYTKTYTWTKAENSQNGKLLFRGQGVYLDIGGNTYLEFFPTGKKGQSMKSGTIAHFSLLVSNVDDTYKKALRSGANKNVTTSPSFWDGTPTTIILNGNPALKERIAYIEGLNGEAIELYELQTPIPAK